MARVLGRVEKVVEFDQLRHELKRSGKKPSTAQVQRHDKLLAELQTLIQNVNTSTMQQTRDLEIIYPVRLFKSCYASLEPEPRTDSLVLVGVASLYRILIVQRRARASQLHKRSAHLKVNTCSFQSCN